MIPKSCSLRLLFGVLVTLTLAYFLIWNWHLHLTNGNILSNVDESLSTEDKRGLSECKCQNASANQENVEPKRVVSYSLFGDVGNSVIRKRYYDRLEKRILEIQSRLPGRVFQFLSLYLDIFFSKLILNFLRLGNPSVPQREH